MQLLFNSYAVVAVSTLAMAYVVVFRHMRMRSDAEFAVVAAIQLVCLLLLLLLQRPDAVCGRIEGFLDSAKGITDDLLMPSLNRLIKGMTPPTAPKDESSEDRWKREQGPKSVSINAAYLSTTGINDPEAVKRVQLEYKRIGFLLCRLNELNQPAFARILGALGAPPPEYQEMSEEDKAAEGEGENN